MRSAPAPATRPPSRRRPGVAARTPSARTQASGSGSRSSSGRTSSAAVSPPSSALRTSARHRRSTSSPASSCSHATSSRSPATAGERPQRRLAAVAVAGQVAGRWRRPAPSSPSRSASGAHSSAASTGEREVRLDHRVGRLDGAARRSGIARLGGGGLAGDQHVPDRRDGDAAAKWRSGAGRRRRTAHLAGPASGRVGGEREVVVVDQVEVRARSAARPASAAACDLDRTRAPYARGRRRGCGRRRPRAPAAAAAPPGPRPTSTSPSPSCSSVSRSVPAVSSQPARQRVQVTSARRGQRVDQVLQRGVAPGVPGEVGRSCRR